MKKYVVLFYTLFCSIIFGFSQPQYNIQKTFDGYDVQITLTHNNCRNKLLIDNILNDSLIYKCTSMVIDGNFTKFPSNFHKISWIKEMQITSKKPFVVDSQFSFFDKLESLIIFSEIKFINKSIRLSNIEFIWFQYSKLQKFPLAICSWQSLKNVDIQDCNFDVLPKEIGNLQKMEILNLSNDNISLLPEEFYSLRKLKTIGLSNNSLTTISSLICNMENLEWICLDDNNLGLDKETEECLSGILQSQK